MKKIYLSALTLGLMAGTAVAQSVAPSTIAEEISTAKPSTVTPLSQLPGEKALGVTFYSDNFDAASNWVLDNSGQGGGAFGWSIDNVNDGWWSSNGISSTSGGAYAELSNGDAQAGSQALDVIYTMTTAAPIDIQTLGGTDQVSLSFEQYGARFNDLQEIQISTDGVNFITVGDNLDKSVLSASGGAAYSNPEVKTINLAPFIAGNAGSVWIRFSWTTNYPTFSTNPNVWITYGWYIDDLKLTTNPDNDLSVSETYWGSVGLNYYQIPLTQVAPIDFSANVFNEGINTQTNTVFTVDVNSGTFVGTSAPASIASNTGDSLFTTTQFTPAALGNYTATRTITQDQVDDVPTNNTMSSIVFDVTNFVYARDNNTPSGTSSNGTDEFEVGNLFDCFADQMLYGINFRLNSTTPAGTEFFGKLYSIDPSTGDFVYETETAPLNSTSQMASGIARAAFITPVNLVAGETYLIVLAAPSGDLVVRTAGSSDPQTSFFYDGADLTWYYTTNTPMVRMDFDPSVGLEENTSISGVSLFPNPSTETTSIEFNLENASDVTITVTDLTGKTVETINLNTVNAGTSTQELNVASFAAGIYNVTISSNEAAVTTKFIKK